MSKRRFKDFSDDEVYMLKRQAIESSCNIVMVKNYEDSLKKIHSNLMNEIIDELRFRDRQKQ